MTQPGWIRFCSKTATIEKDLAIAWNTFSQDHEQCGCIYKFRHKRRSLTVHWGTSWQTSRMGMVLEIVLEPFSRESSSPRQSLRFFRIQVSIGEPYAGEVGLIVMRPRYRLPGYRGTLADRCRKRARIVPKRIEGATFSQPDVEL